MPFIILLLLLLLYNYYYYTFINMVNDNNSHSFHTPLQYGWFSLVLSHITLACPAEMGVERSQGECVGRGFQLGCRFTAVMCWGWECAGLELTLHISAYPVVS